MYNYIINLPIEIQWALIWFCWSIIAVLLALWIGFQYWKKQTRKQKEFEAVLDFFEAIIKYYNAIKNVRSPWMPISEYWPYIDDSDKWFSKWISYAYQKRWEWITSSRTTLQDKQIIVELLLWKSVMDEKLKSLYDLQSDLLIQIQTYLDFLKGARDSSYNHQIIYWSFNKEDSFDLQLLSKIDTIQKEMQHYLLK